MTFISNRGEGLGEERRGQKAWEQRFFASLFEHCNIRIKDNLCVVVLCSVVHNANYYSYNDEDDDDDNDDDND